MNWIKAYIVDVLPCLSIAFFVLAYIYNSAFYSVFGIDIIHYASFGDIFLSITEPLVLLAIFVAIILCLYVQLYNYTLPRMLELEQKKKQKPISISNCKRKYLGLLAKIRRTKFVSLIYKIIKFKPFGDNSTFDILFALVLLFAIFFICFVLFFYVVSLGKIRLTLSSCSIGLIIPAVSGLATTYYNITRNPKEEAKRINKKDKRVLKIVLLLACYYFYAFEIFYNVGLEYGNMIKSQNTVNFEIYTTNGTAFTDKEYGYIGHMSKNTFLFNRASDETVVLSADGIEYTKIKDNTTHKNHSVFVNFLYFEQSIFDMF